MAMFGKKKQSSEQDESGGEADTTVSRPRQPELLARENRAQAIPAGPSRISGQGAGSASSNRPQRPSQSASGANGDQAAASPAGAEKSGDEVKKPSEPASRPSPAFGAALGQGAARPAVGTSPNAGGKRLSVGPGISLSGEIKNCEHLLVEGEIEATLKDCDSLEIAKGGVFKGTAEVQRAVVTGRFEGDLKVLDCLTVKNGGEVQGSVTYADLSIERGGRLRGKMEELNPKS